MKVIYVWRGMVTFAVFGLFCIQFWKNRIIDDLIEINQTSISIHRKTIRELNKLKDKVEEVNERRIQLETRVNALINMEANRQGLTPPFRLEELRPKK